MSTAAMAILSPHWSVGETWLAVCGVEQLRGEGRDLKSSRDGSEKKRIEGKVTMVGFMCGTVPWWRSPWREEDDGGGEKVRERGMWMLRSH